MRPLSVLLLAAAAAAPLSMAQRDVRAGEAYLDHVLRYHSGERRAVTAELAAWSPDDLEFALRGLPAALVIVTEKARISQPTVVASAMAMHVEIARRADGAEQIGLHLSIGQRLSDLLPHDEPSKSFRARWHLLAGTLMFSLSRPAEALQQFEIARDLRPQDPGILLALGSVHEMERSIRGRGNVLDEHLREAIGLYRSALATAPDLHEARLRLARTHYLLGDFAAAATAIAAIDRRATDGHLRYLTVLIGGSIAESAGRLDEAIDRFRQARALCRDCHSATLALSQALVRTGDRAAANELVDRLVNDAAWPPPMDPWWVYQQGQWHSIDGMLEQLRREVPK